MKRRYLVAIAAILLSKSLAAQCTNLSIGQTCVSVATLRITGAGVYSDHIDIKPGVSADLGFIAKDSVGGNITHHIVSWTSADSRIASVSTGGKLTGLQYGKTQITLKVGLQSTTLPVLVTPGASLSCVTGNPCHSVTTLKPIPPNVAGDSLDHADAVKGYSYSMGLIAKDSVGQNISGHTVRWFTSDTTIMAVSSSGRITGKTAGLTTLWLRVGLSLTSIPACVSNTDYVALLTGIKSFKGETGNTWQADTVAMNGFDILLSVTPVRMTTAQAVAFRAAEKINGFSVRSDACVHWGSSVPNLVMTRSGAGVFSPSTSPIAIPVNFGVKASLGRRLP